MWLGVWKAVTQLPACSSERTPQAHPAVPCPISSPFLVPLRRCVAPTTFWELTTAQKKASITNRWTRYKATWTDGDRTDTPTPRSRPTLPSPAPQSKASYARAAPIVPCHTCVSALHVPSEPPISVPHANSVVQSSTRLRTTSARRSGTPASRSRSDIPASPRLSTSTNPHAYCLSSRTQS